MRPFQKNHLWNREKDKGYESDFLYKQNYRLIVREPRLLFRFLQGTVIPF